MRNTNDDAYEEDVAPKTLAEYQEFVQSMTLPGADRLEYGILNLASESGELVGMFTKQMRDGNVIDGNDIAKELGDCLFMVVHVCNQIGFEVEDVMRMNVEKLWGRAKRGTISGSGDDRDNVADINPITLDKAMDLAETAEGKSQHAALCLDKRGRIIGEAINQTRTHPVQAYYAEKSGHPKKVSLHAEIGALIDAGFHRGETEVHTVVVCRVNKKGNPRNSKPCPTCQMALEKAGVERVIYSTNYGWEIKENEK